MTQNMNNLDKLGKEIIEINILNGWKVLTPEDWEDNYRIPTSLALIHSEVSEALEGFRHGDIVNFSEELADILIRVLDLSCGLGIDIEHEVNKKLDINRNRGYKHGGKKI